MGCNANVSSVASATQREKMRVKQQFLQRAAGPAEPPGPHGVHPGLPCGRWACSPVSGKRGPCRVGPRGACLEPEGPRLTLHSERPGTPSPASAWPLSVQVGAPKPKESGLPRLPRLQPPCPQPQVCSLRQQNKWITRNEIQI